ADIHAALGTPANNLALYQYGGIIQFGTGMCAWMTSSALATFILWVLDLTHSYITLGNYGLAIILLVIVVRLLLHPLTRYSQVNMAVMQKKMAAIQPEIDRVKKKYAKDKTQQQAALMQVYKDKKVNPAGGIMGCLPMLLQMPIWIALYSGLAVDIDLRHASFITGWIDDLSNPDTVLQTQTSFHMPVLGLTHNGLPFIALNVLPILLGIVFFIQMRIQSKTMPKPADEQQAQTQKISQYMILLFPLFLYNAPSGLNLYIFASTAGGIFDTWLVRRHMRAKGMLPGQQMES
ncbi:MAG: YidC/Oxa1 family membrane protein insertase, partial [Phycisphaerae bacterium]